MNVLLISGDFSTWGGMDRANYELAWYLAEEAGAQIKLVAYEVAEPLASHPNVFWRRVPKPLNSYTLAAPLLARYGRTAARSNQGIGAQTVVNGGNCTWPDINWVHAVQQAWEPRIAHAPILFRGRQWLSQRNDLRAEKHALQMARIVVVNSKETRIRLVSDLGLSPSRVHTIYYGTDPSIFRPATPTESLTARSRLGWPPNTLTAIFVGALGHDRRKGFDVLFEAWLQLCSDSSWDVNLAAAGGGAEAAYWKSKAERAGLGNRIHMLGFTKNIPEVIRAADVMVHPVFYEPYGLGVHEALCCGVPALVTRSAGVAERYPAAFSDLLLEHPPSVGDVVDRLRRWRADHEGCRSRLQSFSDQLRQRTWRDMAREFVEVTMPGVTKNSALAARSGLDRV